MGNVRRKVERGMDGGETSKTGESRKWERERSRQHADRQVKKVKAKKYICIYEHAENSMRDRWIDRLQRWMQDLGKRYWEREDSQTDGCREKVLT